MTWGKENQNNAKTAPQNIVPRVHLLFRQLAFINPRLIMLCQFKGLALSSTEVFCEIHYDENGVVPYDSSVYRAVYYEGSSTPSGFLSISWLNKTLSHSWR